MALRECSAAAVGTDSPHTWLPNEGSSLELPLLLGVLCHAMPPLPGLWSSELCDDVCHTCARPARVCGCCAAHPAAVGQWLAGTAAASSRATGRHCRASQQVSTWPTRVHKMCVKALCVSASKESQL